MAPEPHSRQIPDVLLERLLAGDLPAAERARVQAAVDLEPATRERLDRLQAEKRAFLAENPAAPFAHQVAVRLAVSAADTPPRRRWLWAWVLGPSLAVAASFVVVATVVQRAPEGQIAATAAPVAALRPAVPPAQAMLAPEPASAPPRTPATVPAP